MPLFEKKYQSHPTDRTPEEIEKIAREGAGNYLRNNAAKGLPAGGKDTINLGNGGKQKSAPPSE